jgi:hypothetical protein
VQQKRRRRNERVFLEILGIDCQDGNYSDVVGEREQTTCLQQKIADPKLARKRLSGVSNVNALAFGDTVCPARKPVISTSGPCRMLSHFYVSR